MVDLSLPMAVYVNWILNTNYKSFDISFSVEKFVDTFSIEFNNFKGSVSTTVPVGWIVEIYAKGILLFRWIIENKTVRYNPVWSTMTCSWREEIVVLTETDVSPNIWPFKNYIDNDIIRLLLKWYWRDLSLWDGKKIKEYSVSGKSVRIWQVLDDVCKFNDFMLFKRWNTIYKRPRPENPNSWGLKYWPKLYLNTDEDNFYLSENRIMTIDITEDISSVRSIVNGFTYTSWKGKAQAKSTLKNNQLTSGSYASRVRNLAGIKWYWLNRVGNVLTPAKDSAELWVSTLNLLRDNDMKATITIEMYWFQNINMLDIVKVVIESEKIAQDMRVKEIQYRFDSTNKSITKLVVQPFIKLSP